jgi:hypothetical protein
MTRNASIACSLISVAALVACTAEGPRQGPPLSGTNADGAGPPFEAATPTGGAAGGRASSDAGVVEAADAGAGATTDAGAARTADTGAGATTDARTDAPTNGRTDAPTNAGAGATTDAANTDLERCPSVSACDAAPPDPGAARPWRHKAPSGAANHRGRDLFVNPGGPQWVIATLRYGLPLLESGLTDEEVDIYLLRACGATWEKLGSALIAATPSHPDVEGVGDAPGRLFFEIPADRRLAAGRHRLRVVVAGDLSAAELFIEVVPPGTPLFVSDVDGTLTTSEDAQTISLLTGVSPAENRDAPQVLTLLARKGYRPLYLTARPEWLSSSTRDWLAGKGFPPGIVHTTLSSGTTSGAAATTYKSDELTLLANKGLKPTFAFGNTSSDADAYNNADIKPLADRIFYQYTDSAWNGRRVDDYASLLSEWASLPPVCR